MRSRIFSEPSFAMGMGVWFVAATVFPWQLGLAGASLLGFIGYLAIAGMLLAVADALLNESLYHGVDDVFLQGLFWTIGLSVPAAALFALGNSAAPAADDFQDSLCVITGLANPADHSEAPLEEALEPSEACEIDD